MRHNEEITNTWHMNERRYNDTVETVRNCKDNQTKLRIYKSIYDVNNEIPATSFTMTAANEYQRKLLTRYIVSSHNLACETSKWVSGANRNCKKCIQGSDVMKLLCILFANVMLTRV